MKMLNKQVQIYSFDTSSFYNEAEMQIHNEMVKFYILRKQVETHLKKVRSKKGMTDQQELKSFDYIVTTIKNLELLIPIDFVVDDVESIKNLNKYCSDMISSKKQNLLATFKETRANNNGIRELRKDQITDRKIVSIFESDLLRCMGAKVNTLIDDLMIVQTFFFDVIEDIIKDGFTYNGEKYVCFTASAGQIRVKKVVFIKKSTYDKVANQISCGLSLDEINEKGGMNINKYLAYLALCNSATDEWSDFDIDRAIVVDDMETLVPSEVDFIDDETYTIERRKMDVPIPHMDGCGMILTSTSRKNFMFRMPWFKGLLASFPFKKFILEQRMNGNESCGIVKDIWGTEHDIIKEGIKYIFTKSQFKMYKFYDSWDDYKERFKKYDCHANKCNVEDDTFADARINYQMLQSLFILNDEDINDITRKTRVDIDNVGRDTGLMLKLLGADGTNSRETPFQEAVRLYNPILRDNHTKETIRDVKRSRVKNGRAGKLDISGKYTFLIPDLYAFCEWLFLGEDNPTGILERNQVSCKLFKQKKVDCLRSPHLYVEHAVRENTHNSDTKKWFVTNGLYTSVHDVISKVLQFDNDGDKSLVTDEEVIVNTAEKEIEEYDIVPLYYNMRKADAQILNNEVLFNGMKTAWTGGNIGLYSNDISKIYNSDKMVYGTKEDRMECLKVIKLLCMENNFVIDYAKTLYKPKRPKWAKDLITSFTKAKLPHFFVYAKDKTEEQVEAANDSVVNKFESVIKNTPIKFDFGGGYKTLDKFEYENLLHNKDFEFDERSQEIIDAYFYLNDHKKQLGTTEYDGDKNTSYDLYVYKAIRDNLLELNDDVNYVVDTLVSSLYKTKPRNVTLEEQNLYNINTSRKDTLWYTFGDVIIKNIKHNVGDKKEGVILKRCECCGRVIVKASNRAKYCTECAKTVIKERDRIRKRNKFHI